MPNQNTQLAMLLEASPKIVEASPQGLAEWLLQAVDGAPIDHAQCLVALFIAAGRLAKRYPCCTGTTRECCRTLIAFTDTIDAEARQTTH